MVEDHDLPRVSTETLLAHEERLNEALRTSLAAVRTQLNKSEKWNFRLVFVIAAVGLVCYGFGSAMGREAAKIPAKELERYQAISECVGKNR